MWCNIWYCGGLILIALLVRIWVISSYIFGGLVPAVEEGTVVNSGGLISQQVKFSMVKIESYEGLLK